MDRATEIWKETRKLLKVENQQISIERAYNIENDIKHLLFTFSRYKFASKLLAARSNAIDLLEIGCHDGLGTRFFRQSGVCKKIVGVDFEHDNIVFANKTFNEPDTKFIEDNCLGKNYGKFDAVVTLDVIEHIDQEQEKVFVKTLADNLNDKGFAIVGTPSVALYPYACEVSKLGHINNFDQERLQKLMEQEFDNVFIFGMNDEVVHTGFYPLTCYIFALCCNKKTR